jgi:hypothetical protein
LFEFAQRWCIAAPDIPILLAICKMGFLASSIRLRKISLSIPSKQLGIDAISSYLKL